MSLIRKHRRPDGPPRGSFGGVDIYTPKIISMGRTRQGDLLVNGHRLSWLDRRRGWARVPAVVRSMDEFVDLYGEHPLASKEK